MGSAAPPILVRLSKQTLRLRAHRAPAAVGPLPRRVVSNMPAAEVEQARAIRPVVRAEVAPVRQALRALGKTAARLLQATVTAAPAVAVVTVVLQLRAPMGPMEAMVLLEEQVQA